MISMGEEETLNWEQKPKITILSNIKIKTVSFKVLMEIKQSNHKTLKRDFKE